MFQDNLKRRRLELGLSQEELAIKVGYSSRSSISKLESGNADISKKKLLLLAQALDTTPEELLSMDTVGIDVQPDSYSFKKHKTIALIQAGGRSTRNLLNVPNQFINVDGKPIIVYVLEAYEKHPSIDEIVVACAYGWERVLQSYVKKYHITKAKHIVTGGNTILDSIRLAYNQVKMYMEDNDVIILQEATRPLVNTSLISKLLSSYEMHGDSVIVRPMNDYVQFTVSCDKENYVDRDSLFSLESPEVYSVQTLKAVLSTSAKKVKDDGACLALILYRLGMKIHFCENTSSNLKIVHQEDSYIFKILHSLQL